MAVVVLDVEVQDVKKLPPPGDQEMVQALLAHGANPALGDGVGVRRLDRRQDDLGAEPVPDIVESPGELAVSVADQEPDDSGLLSKRDGLVAGLLGDPGAGGVGGDAGEMHTPVVQLDEEQHVLPSHSRRRNTVSTVRKSQVRMPAAWWRRNDRHVVDLAARRGAGWRPLARSTLAMELPETRQPRRSSSPRRRW